MPTKHDLIFIGGGPAGYVGAIRAAQLGLNVACIEKEPQLGGTCLRVGCIPSKALLESSHKYEAARHELKDHGINVGDVSFDLAKMMDRKATVVEQLSRGVEGLLAKHKVSHYAGLAKFTAANTVVVEPNAEGEDAIELEAEHIVIATGSHPSTLPGVEFDADHIGCSTDALRYDKAPEHLIVIGGGYIGLELGSVWRRLGSRVTVLEYLDRVLPGLDSEIAKEAHKQFKRQGIEFHLGSKVTGAKVKNGKSKKGKVTITREGHDDLHADKVLVATGRQPHTMGLGLEDIGVEIDKRGFIPVDDHYQTSVKGVYAVGDVIPTPMLAHVAEEEAIAVVEMIATGVGHVDYNAIPAVVFTHPEIAAVGQTEDQLKENDIAYNKGKFPFMANGRAKTLNDTVGFVKVLSDAKTDRVLGIHIIGPSAGDLIAEATMAMSCGASAEDIARTCHCHPTLPEAVKEAALASLGRVISM